MEGRRRRNRNEWKEKGGGIGTNGGKEEEE